MMACGHVNTLGLPVYVEQPREPFTQGLTEFNILSTTNAGMFVGRWVAQTELLSLGGCGRARAVQLELPALLWHPCACWWRAHDRQPASSVCPARLQVRNSCSAVLLVAVRAALRNNTGTT